MSTNTAASNPTISITSPSNGDVVSSNLTVSVAASSSDILANLKLYVDGQEMNPSEDGTNFVINTCEWWNGSHTLFATAKSMSHFEGLPNDPSPVVYGRAVSSYVTVNFSNLITRVAFSQPYFEPSLGQTQQVTASFTANCNWTLQIQDVNGNPVRTETGSGSSLLFNWDGTGDGETNIPDARYTFHISASTNGAPMSMLSGGGSSLSVSKTKTLWALTEGSENPVPLAIIPIGFDTNGMTIFSATQSEVDELVEDTNSESMLTPDGGGFASPMGFGAAGTSQSTDTPDRPPTIEGKGTVGTFYAGYQDYYTSSGQFSTPAILTGNLIVNKFVQLDGRTLAQASGPETFNSISEFGDLARGFSEAMQGGRYSGSVNPFILSSDVTGGIFNNANVGLLCCHASYGMTAQSDGLIRSYLRFLISFGQGPTFCKLDSCNFGGSASNQLKYMAILACNVLQNTPYNSMYIDGKLPINNDLHLLLSTSTFATAAPNIGRFWAGYMLGTRGPNGVQTVEQSWYKSGQDAYAQGETAHLVIKFRVAGWPSAFSENITDKDSSPGTGNVLDIVKTDFTVYSNP